MRPVKLLLLALVGTAGIEEVGSSIDSWSVTSEMSQTQAEMQSQLQELLSSREKLASDFAKLAGEMQELKEHAVIGTALQAYDASVVKINGGEASLPVHGQRPGDVLWKLMTSTLVFLMQLGFAMIESGMCRQVNVIATYAKNILDFTFGSLCALLFGYNIAYGINAIGFERGDPRQAQFFSHIVFQATAATILSGAMAERTTVWGYCMLSIWMSGVVFSCGVAVTWGGGCLSKLDPPFHDYSGAGVVHVVGGAAAIVGAYIVGPRRGRWEARKHGDFAPHDVKSVLGGVLVLWVAWYGFNPGSSTGMTTLQDAADASNAALTTTMSGSAAGLAAAITSRIHSRMNNDEDPAEVDVLTLANGILAGLVAITAGCDSVEPWGALIIGLVSGVVFHVSSIYLAEVLHVDDVVDAGSVHCIAGMWGCIAVGFFDSRNGLFFGGGLSLLITQIIGTFFLALMSMGLLAPVALLLKRASMLRVSVEHEAKGLDHHFGIKALVHESDRLLQYKAMQDLLASQGLEVEDFMDSLYMLRSLTPLSFSPGDGVTNEREIRSYFERVQYDFIEEYTKREQDIIDANQGIKEFRKWARLAKLNKMLVGDGKAPTRPPPDPDASKGMDSSNHGSPGGTDAPAQEQQLPTPPPLPLSLPGTSPMGPPEEFDMSKSLNMRLKELDDLQNDPYNIKRLGYVSFYKNQAMDAAWGFVSVVKELAYAGSESKAEGFLKNTYRAAKYLKRDEFMMLNTEMKGVLVLDPIVRAIEESASFVLVLSRECLEQPINCLELCAAHRAGLPIVPVIVEWPMLEREGRDFRFPYDLELLITELSTYMEARGIKKRGTGANKTYNAPYEAALLRGGDEHNPPEKTWPEIAKDVQRTAVEWMMDAAMWLEELPIQQPWLKKFAVMVQEKLTRQTLREPGVNGRRSVSGYGSANGRRSVSGYTLAA